MMITTMKKIGILFAIVFISSCQHKGAAVSSSKASSPITDISLVAYGIDDTAKCDIRVGHTNANDGEEQGVSNFGFIDSTFAYHIFSNTGEELFKSLRFREQHPGGCDESDNRTSWLLIPDTTYDFEETKKLSEQSYCLVIGCRSTVRFKTPVKSELTESEKLMCLKAILSKDTIDTSIFASQCFYSAGESSGIRRYLAILQSSDTTIKSTTVVFEIEKGITKILFRDFREQNETVTTFCGQADRNGDGLSETFAIDFGDYGGKWVLKFGKGIWSISLDFGPSPC